jgi:hypothetical protein
LDAVVAKLEAFWRFLFAIVLSTTRDAPEELAANGKLYIVASRDCLIGSRLYLDKAFCKEIIITSAS